MRVKLSNLLVLSTVIVMVVAACSDENYDCFCDAELPIIVTSERYLAFEPVNIGESSSKVFTLENVGIEDLIFEFRLGDPDQFVVRVERDIDYLGERLTLEPTGSQEIQVLFTPTQPESVSSVLTIHSNDPSNPEHEIALLAHVSTGSP